MTDIVERLRKMADDMLGPYRRLTLEAAAEIERLRAALGPSATEAWAHMYDETVRLQAETERLRKALRYAERALENGE